MDDYLSDLVTKNIGTAEVIQPRHAALFEPVQPRDAFEIEAESMPVREAGVDKENTTETPLNVRPRREHETKSGEKSAAALSPEDPEEQIVRTPVIVRSETRPLETEQIVSPASLASQEIKAPHGSTNQSSSKPGASASRSSTIVTPKEPMSELDSTQENPVDAVINVPVQTRRPSQSKTNEFEASEERAFDAKIAKAKNRDAADSDTRDPEEQSTEAQTPIVAEPRVAIAENRFGEKAIQPMRISFPRAQTSKQISNRGETSEASVINVTIGRVEVRAVAAPASPKETRRPKSRVMSLDEYLQKRGNGGAQ